MPSDPTDTGPTAIAMPDPVAALDGAQPALTAQCTDDAALLSKAVDIFQQCRNLNTLINEGDPNGDSHSTYMHSLSADTVTLLRQLSSIRVYIQKGSQPLSIPAKSAVVADLTLIQTALQSIPHSSKHYPQVRQSSASGVGAAQKKRLSLNLFRGRAARTRAKRMLREACERARLCAARLEMVRINEQGPVVISKSQHHHQQQQSGTPQLEMKLWKQHVLQRHSLSSPTATPNNNNNRSNAPTTTGNNNSKRVSKRFTFRRSDTDAGTASRSNNNTDGDGGGGGGGLGLGCVGLSLRRSLSGQKSLRQSSVHGMGNSSSTAKVGRPGIITPSVSVKFPRNSTWHDSNRSSDDEEDEDDDDMVDIVVDETTGKALLQPQRTKPRPPPPDCRVPPHLLHLQQSSSSSGTNKTQTSTVLPDDTEPRSEECDTDDNATPKPMAVVHGVGHTVPQVKPMPVLTKSASRAGLFISNAQAKYQRSKAANSSGNSAASKENNDKEKDTTPSDTGGVAPTSRRNNRGTSRERKLSRPRLRRRRINSQTHAGNINLADGDADAGANPDSANPADKKDSGSGSALNNPTPPSRGRSSLLQDGRQVSPAASPSPIVATPSAVGPLGIRRPTTPTSSTSATSQAPRPSQSPHVSRGSSPLSTPRSIDAPYQHHTDRNKNNSVTLVKPTRPASGATDMATAALVGRTRVLATAAAHTPVLLPSDSFTTTSSLGSDGGRTTEDLGGQRHSSGNRPATKSILLQTTSQSATRLPVLKSSLSVSRSSPHTSSSGIMPPNTSSGSVSLPRAATSSGDMSASVMSSSGGGVGTGSGGVSRHSMTSAATTTTTSSGDGASTAPKRNVWRAASMYKKAADTGDVRAMCDLGTCYQNGVGVDRDVGAAVRLFEKAASLSYPRGQFCLARCYAFGEGIARDTVKAVALYRQAADNGHAAAMCNLGVCLQKGIGVNHADPAGAVTLYKRAGENGYARAWYNLGVCYESGCGVQTKNIARAVTLYKRAAKGGFSSAMCTLGACYESGTGVERDITKAVAWYKKAAKHGCMKAHYLLALCYHRGVVQHGDGSTGRDSAILAASDREEAIRLLQKAADAGIQDAALYLKSIQV